MNNAEFLFSWLVFSVLIFAFIGVVLFLSHRAGYFRDQDRARYLALWAEVPEQKAADAEFGSQHQIPHSAAGKQNKA